MTENKMDKVVSLAKRRGFIFPGSEIYGGLANTYDYGTMGVELMRNIRNIWWKVFVHLRSDVVGLEASLISHQEVWKASGHVGGFSDALVDCRKCKTRMRADHLIEDWLENNFEENKNHVILSDSEGSFREGKKDSSVKPQNDKLKKISAEELKKAFELKKVEGWSEEKMDAFIQHFSIPCPKCKAHEWTGVRKFNLLFPVNLGIIEGDQSLAYLRGETAQGMFADFKNVIESTRVRLPFGIAQNGKSFRNEITPGNSVFRTLVFEQSEIEYFFDPDQTFWEQAFEEWKNAMWEFVTKYLGIKEENLRWRTHTDEERSFYSKRTEDLEYMFPFGYKELWGLAYRTDYDLKQHMQFSGKDLSITDPQTGKKIIPHVIEPAVGNDRLFLMALCDAYDEEEKRIVLKLNPNLAPYKVAVFPLLANKEDLVKKAKEVYDLLKEKFATAWDDRGNIGKRYLYQDEIGTPWCVTVDFDTLEDGTVTVRDRDTMQQERIAIDKLSSYFSEKLS